MVGGRRVPLAEHAERVNAAAELLAADVPVAAAARGLAERFGVSTREARRYAKQAAGSGRVPVPEARVVFTVKLPASLADRVRERARQTGVTISALVAQALTEFLGRRRARANTKPAPRSRRERTDRQPGGQPGHPGATLGQVATPAERVRHRPEVCAGCRFAHCSALGGAQPCRRSARPG